MYLFYLDQPHKYIQPEFLIYLWTYVIFMANFILNYNKDDMHELYEKNLPFIFGIRDQYFAFNIWQI